MPTRPSASVIALLALCAAPAPLLGAQSPALPPGFVAQPVGSGWIAPTAVAWIDPSRMLVAERRGSVWLVEDDLRGNKVLDLSFEILTNGDRGLLGMTVDPAFAENGFLYLLYVVDPDGDGTDNDPHTFSRLVRYTTHFAGSALIADPDSRVELIGADWPSGIPSCHLSHTVGALRFLSDGSLVLATGDGAHYDLTDSGGRDAPCFGEGRFSPDQDVGSFRSQYEGTLAGKVLRIDPATGLGLPDNPGYEPGDPGSIRSRVWAKGLRNPFRMTLVPGSGPTETLLVGDVGWNTWEEVNVVRGGENFGWPCFEGAAPQPSYQNQDVHGFCADAAATHEPPILAWHHSSPGDVGFAGVCVSGLALVDCDLYPPVWRDRLFFTDFGGSYLKAARLDDALQVVDVLSFGARLTSPVDLEVNPFTGELFLCSLSGSMPRVWRLRYVGANRPPVARVEASTVFGPAPLLVVLDASTSFDPEGDPLAYAWSLGDGTTATGAQVTKTYPDPTRDYRVVLTATDGEGRTGTAELVITPGNTPPRIVEVVSPADGASYRGGEPIELRSRVEDDEDAADGREVDVVWHLDLLEDHTVHPDWVVASGAETTVVPPSHGAGTNHYRVRLVATDGRGLTDERTLELFDADALPAVHLVAVSDPAPRRGQEVEATAHVHWPGHAGAGVLPELVLDWGDGTADSVPAAADQVDLVRTHAYAAAGSFELRAAVRLGAHLAEESVSILVREPRPAVAVFAPVLVERWAEWTEHQAIADAIATTLGAKGVEVAVFHFGQGAELAAWMQAYLDDGVRDHVVLVDYVPDALFAGETDGSLAEEWMEHGNGIVWTGQEAFYESLRDDGSTLVNSPSTGAGYVIDANSSSIFRGNGVQQIQPGALVEIPSLVSYNAHRALRRDQIGPAWSLARLWAEDGDADADAVQIQNGSGGYYAQFCCSLASNLPRAAVLAEFLRGQVTFTRRPAGIVTR